MVKTVRETLRSAWDEEKSAVGMSSGVVGVDVSQSEPLIARQRVLVGAVVVAGFVVVFVVVVVVVVGVVVVVEWLVVLVVVAVVVGRRCKRIGRERRISRPIGSAGENDDQRGKAEHAREHIESKARKQYKRSKQCT